MVIFRKRVPGLSEVALAKFLARACRAARLRGTVNVAVTGSRELRALNNRFRGKDKPTDVLSFPPVLGLSRDFAGDVAISAEIAAQSARRLGHSAAEEVKILALHGVLHLAGYDHERDRDQMARKEEGLRKSLGLPVGLIERSGPSENSQQKASTAKFAKDARRKQRKARSASPIRATQGSR
ncbi:MAG: rRNA maturation RNase YbeY [Acidobacteriia bacterium]|nr:rRNA maturation RNase YbeY [Terriglobia bacterium]